MIKCIAEKYFHGAALVPLKKTKKSIELFEIHFEHVMHRENGEEENSALLLNKRKIRIVISYIL